MRQVEYSSRLHTVRKLKLSGDPSLEPSFVAATCSSVRKNAGEVVNNFIDSVNAEGWQEGSYLLYIYNKHLFPGSWPIGSPGWHVDAQGGSDPARAVDLPLEHLVCSLDYSEEEEKQEVGTEFAIGDIIFNVPTDLKAPEKYKFSWWHAQIEDQIRAGTLTVERIHDLTMHAFDNDAFHRTPWMTRPGKRLLMSATRVAGRSNRKLLSGVEMPLNLKNLAYVPLEDGSGWKAVDMAA